MPSKSAAASATESPKVSKSKLPKSAEFVDDSDLDNSEPMNDAPPIKSNKSKPAEKTSKKRNRDGTEKVNGDKITSTVSSKPSVSKSTSAEKSKGEQTIAKTSKTLKKIEQIVESSTEESESESASSSEAESSSEDDDDNKEAGGSGSESESETTTAPPSKTTPKSFTLPVDTDVPSGFTPLEATSSSSIPSSLEGKQIFVFTAPARFNLSEVKKIRLHSGMDGETIRAGESSFTIKRTPASTASGMKVILPREGKKGYKLASIASTAHFTITEAPPSARSNADLEQAQAPGPRRQPEGLRMRFMPAGYGEETDIHINKDVLPKMDLVVTGEDADVVMDDVQVVPPTPKKSKKGEGKAVEPPTPKDKKKKSKAPEGGILAAADEESPENIEEHDKKARKSKDKKRHEEGEEKKEKKSKRKDEEKKEKKKHKKDKAEV